MSEVKIKKKNQTAIRDLRIRAAQKGILTLSDLARRVPCSRVCIYFSLENPSRFPRVTRRIKELIK